MKHPKALIILDGFGHSAQHEHNAIARAQAPTIEYFRQHYPHTLLQASGAAVGLLDGVVGNSEVGHFTIGTGRITIQPSFHISHLLEQKKLENIPVIAQNFAHISQTGNTLHIMGLVSDGAIHAHIDHMIAFIDYAHHAGIKHIALHCFLDGRDSPPRSAPTYLIKLQNHIRHIPQAFIADITGRFYAMDRNKEWSRTEQTYHILTQEEPVKFQSWQEAIQAYYAQDITDEFIPPTQLNHEGIIRDGDGIILTNYRPDRARQLLHAFLQTTFTPFARTTKKLAFFITPTVIDPAIATEALLQAPDLTNTLMDVLHEHGITSMNIAETEKYAHVTYFFNAGREEPYETECWHIIPSISARTYEEFPCMRAREITQYVLQSLKEDTRDFYVINFANPDMVGHSGNEAATIKAIECLDKQLKRLYQEIVVNRCGTIYLTSDHGNAEYMWDTQNNQPHTSHTHNPVDFFVINDACKNKKILLDLAGLKDIAPFILRDLKIPIPIQME